MQTLSVPPSKISSALETLRRNARTENPSSNQIRATVANLILLTSASSELDITKELVKELAKSYPSRFFIVSLSDSETNSIQVEVASQCIENQSGKQIQTEEIYIEVASSHISVVGNLLLAQFVPDIDVVLVEIDATLEEQGRNEILGQLLPLSDLYLSGAPLIFEGRECPPGFRCQVKSLAGPLVRRWKNVISTQFDVPHIRESVDSIVDVHIVSGGCELSEITSESIMLLNWFLSGMGCSNEMSVRVEGGAVKVAACIGEEGSPKVIEGVISLSGESGQGIKRFACGNNQDSGYSLDCKLSKAGDMLEVTLQGDKLDDKEKEACYFSTRKISFHPVTPVEAIVQAIATEENHTMLAQSIDLESRIRATIIAKG